MGDPGTGFLKDTIFIINSSNTASIDLKTSQNVFLIIFLLLLIFDITIFSLGFYPCCFLELGGNRVYSHHD